MRQTIREFSNNLESTTQEVVKKIIKHFYPLLSEKQIDYQVQTLSEVIHPFEYEVNSILDSSVDYIDDLQSQLEEEYDTTADLRNTIDDLEDERDTLEDEKYDYQNSLETANNTITDLEDKIAQLEEKLEQYEGIINTKE